MNVKLRLKIKAALISGIFLVSSLSLVSPAHAKTYKCSKGGSFKVSKGVLFDGKSCKGKAKVPKSVSKIRTDAFLSNKKLTSVIFAKGSKLNSIGDYAFSGTSISSITIPASVTRIDDSAFYYTKKLKSITFAKGSELTSMGNDAFSNSGLTSITIPASVTRIGNWAFATSKLKRVSFQEGSKLRTFGVASFSGSAVTKISIPASVTRIGAWSFSNSKLQHITVSPGNSRYSSIDGVVFNKDATRLMFFPPKKAISTYTLPNSVTSIEDYAFATSGLSRIEIPEENPSLSSIDGVVFNKAISKLIVFPPKMNLRPYVIPTSVTEIGNGAFILSGLTSITIPNQVAHIGSYAFYGNFLTTIVFPRSVAFMGDEAFYGNPLSRIVFKGNCPENYSNALNGINPPGGSINYSCTSPYPY